MNNAWRFIEVVDKATVAGAERHTWLLSLALARAGHEVVFVAPDGPLWAHRLDSTRLPPTMRTIREERLRGMPWQGAAGLRGALAETPDRAVIHSHLHRADLAAAWFRSVASPAHIFVSTVHSRLNLDVAWTNSPFKRVVYPRLARWALQRMDLVFTVSRSTACHVRNEMGLARSKVIPLKNAIDLTELGQHLDRAEARRRLGWRHSKKPVVVTVGRLEHRKGQHILLRGVASLPADERPDVWLVGSGPAEGELRNLVREVDISECVTFFGQRNDVPLILKAADLYVQPSLWDPLPRSLLEAMALGLPCIGTAVDGIPEVLKDGETGWLVPRESPDALASCILYVLGHTAVAERCARGGLEAVRATHTMDRMASDIVDALNCYCEECHLLQGP